MKLMNNQKGFVNIVLVVLVVVFAGTIGYLFLVRKSEQSSIPSTQTQTTPPPQAEPIVNIPPPQTQPPTNPTPKPSITIVSPNGGENFETERTYVVKWNSTGLSLNTKIRLGYKPIIASSESGSFEIITTTNTGSFGWKTPKTVSGFNDPNGGTWCPQSGTRVTRQYNLEIIALNQNGTFGVSDRSDAPFNLSGPCFEGY